jgi:uncharacterized protein YdeI (YjbR/CyaY-like superfamily)
MSPAPTRKPSALERLEQVYVADRAAWRQWLATNHDRSPGIWLVFDKKSSRADRLAYAHAVEEALCYGWIDSTVRPLDDARYVQLMTPRKPKSNWSRPNKERVERLIAAGLMAAPGLASIERAKSNGSWTRLDVVDAMVVPDDLATALAAVAQGAERFAALSMTARKGFLYWINGAVRPETRARRVAEVAGHVAANRKSRFREETSPKKSSPVKTKATSTKTAKTSRSTKRVKSSASPRTKKRR